MNLAESMLSTISLLSEPVEQSYSAKLSLFLWGMVALGKWVHDMIACLRTGFSEHRTILAW